MPQQSVF